MGRQPVAGTQARTAALAAAMDHARAQGRAATQPRQARRSFDAAAMGRLTEGWLGSLQSLNDDLRGQLDRLRARSRDMAKNNELGARFFNLIVNNVVGPSGFTYQAKAMDPNGQPDKAANDALEWYVWNWMKRCDVAERLRFVDQLRVQVRTLARDGELIWVLYETAAGVQLRMMDPATLDHTINVDRTPAGTRIVMGVEMDAIGRRLFYHFRRRHDPLVERIPASDVIHAFIQTEPDQVRGVPWLHAVMRRMHDLNGYREAAVIAARVGAAKMGVWTTPDGGPPPGTESRGGASVTDAEPGHFDYAPDGYKLEAWDPTYPHDQFDSFCKEAIRGIASGVNVSYHSLGSDLSSINFTSIRAGALEDRDYWMVLQDWLINVALDPIAERVIRHGLAHGKILSPSGHPLPLAKLEKFQAHEWQPRRWQWVDPLKDMNAAIAAINAGLDSPQAIAARAGRDVEDVLDDIERFQQMCRDRGITLGGLKFAPDSRDPPPGEE